MNSILLKIKDGSWHRFRAFVRRPYDVIHGIGLKLGFVFSSIFYPTEKRRLILTSLTTARVYPTMLLIRKGVKSEMRLRLAGGATPILPAVYRGCSRGQLSVAVMAVGVQKLGLRLPFGAEFRAKSRNVAESK